MDGPIGTKCVPTCQNPTPSQAHCTVCHLTLRSVYSFDLHRKAGECVDPTTIGMVERNRVWSRVMAPDAIIARSEKRLRLGRTA